jgi:transposase
MHRPYLNAVARELPKATVVLDKFHVLQHAGQALDDVRRQEFFRAGPVMRRLGRGKRWLLLRRWKTVRGRNAQTCRPCLLQIGACSKRTTFESNSIASGPIRPTMAWPRFCGGG